MSTELIADHFNLLDTTIDNILVFLDSNPKAMPTDMLELIPDEDSEDTRLIFIVEALNELVATGQVAQGVKLGAPAFTLTADGKMLADQLAAFKP